MYTLWIIIVATSLHHPVAYDAMRVHMPLDTRFTCEAAVEDQLDTVAIAKAAALALDAKHKHITIRAVQTSCEETSARI
jgi:hypothetical protein